MPLRNIGEYTFDPSKLRILRPTNEKGKNVRLNPEEMMDKYPVRALMAAPMFNHTGSGKCGPGGLTPCTRQYDSITGVDFPSYRPKSGITLNVCRDSIMGKQYVIVLPQAEKASDANLAIQLYPSLVFDGEIKGKREKVSSVAGLGFNEETKKLVSLVASGGTLKDLADLFLEKGCNYAGYTDAGSSAALYIRGEGYRGVHAKNPKLPCWLVEIN